MLTVADLEVNVLEFRQRAFQFERLATVQGTEYAVFSRTETESESQFRPKLVHLKLVVPHAWLVYDEPNDLLGVSRDGTTVPTRVSEPLVEVRAERPAFSEQGIDWQRTNGPSGALVYAPADVVGALCTPDGYSALGIS